MTVRVVVATRIHLGKSQEPPTDTDLEEKIELFARFCYGDQEHEPEDEHENEHENDIVAAAGGLGVSSSALPPRYTQCGSEIVGVIAVDAENRIAGYDLVESVRRLCSAAADGLGNRRRQIHVLPVQPWGNFTPALNALIHWASSGEEARSQSASQILFVSAETTAPRDSTLAILQSHLTGDTLVVGAVLPGHDFQVPVPDGIASISASTSTSASGRATRWVSRELSGRTTPWNTLALWDLSKLCLTGFLLVSDGLRDSRMGGVEEAAVIALHQSLFPGDRKAKLVPVDGIRWDQQFTDPARRQWHEQKMQSKVERPAYQLGLLRLENGTVEHFVAASQTASDTLRFVVTGFGPFDTIDVNPTETICRNLGYHLQSFHGEIKAKLVRAVIIETSAEAAHQALADIFSACDQFHPTIVIHLGLNKNAICFHLEQCAYNEATFRVPDQRGYRPQQEPVVDHRPIDDSIATSLDVQSLAERMTEVYPNVGTVVSQDPGRFVCNYTYYRSLLLAQNLPNTTSLFVHVPDLTSLSIEDCVIYVERLLEQVQILSATISATY